MQDDKISVSIFINENTLTCNYFFHKGFRELKKTKFLIVIFSLLIIVDCSVNVNTPKKPATTAKSNAKAPPPPLLSFPGFYKGAEFLADGPLWYDGTAKLEEYSAKELRLSILIGLPDIVKTYKIKDGKANIAIKLNKDPKGKFILTISDLYAKKNFNLTDVKITSGKVDGNWFSKEKKYTKISAGKQEYTFTIEDTGKVTISSTGMPGSLFLKRKDLK